MEYLNQFKAIKTLSLSKDASLEVVYAAIKYINAGGLAGVNIDDENPIEMGDEYLEGINSLITWTDRPAEAVDSLEINEVFYGITADSLMALYIVIGKYEDHSLWLPLSMETQFAVMVKKFDRVSKAYTLLGISASENVVDVIYNNASPGDIFYVCDINEEPFDLFDDFDEFDEEDEEIAKFLGIYITIPGKEEDDIEIVHQANVVHNRNIMSEVSKYLNLTKN